MTLLLYKLLTTPTLILLATLVSRRFGEATGGWLVGLPLTSGPIAVFLAVEHGPRFSQLAAAGSLEGTVGQAVFAATYARLAEKFGMADLPPRRYRRIPGVGADGILLDLSMPILAAGAAIACLVAGLRSIGTPPVAAAAAEPPTWDLPARMIVATALVLLVTTIAHAIGPDLSGLAATISLSAVVLAVFAHRHQGSAAAQSVLRGLLLGLFGFVGFFATLSLLVVRSGLAAAFGAALIANLAIHGVAYLVLHRPPPEKPASTAEGRRR